MFGILASCNGPKQSASAAHLSAADGKKAADRLAALLPERLGEFVARAPATSDVYLPEARIRAQRDYGSAERTLQVELKTGNVRAELELLASDSDHAFGSDSKTYWHTVPIKGLRARVAETDDKKMGSQAYVRVSDNVVARLRVIPRIRQDEASDLAASLDLDAIGAAGVP